MPADGYVVIARIVDEWIAFGIRADFHCARAGAQRIQIGRGIVMIVKVNYAHAKRPRSEPWRIPSYSPSRRPFPSAKASSSTPIADTILRCRFAMGVSTAYL